jgi:hypothetical protein
MAALNRAESRAHPRKRSPVVARFNALGLIRRGVLVFADFPASGLRLLFLQPVETSAVRYLAARELLRCRLAEAAAIAMDQPESIRI